jgi:hypothetical protein
MDGAVGAFGERFAQRRPARAGPAVMATTSPPCFSFWRSASSSA